MKQSLQLRLSQHLALTPQLQQSIKLLQLSTVELNQELESILQANPLLERVDGTEAGEGNGESYIPERPSEISTPTQTEEATPSTSNEFDANFEQAFDSSNRWEDNGGNVNDEDSDYGFQEPISITLREHLLDQLKLMRLSDRDQTLTTLLVDAINEDGYLEQSLEELAEIVPEEYEIDPVELSTALKLVQHLDPAGVGGRNLGECLSLQLQIMPADTPDRDLAIKLAENHLADLASRDFAKLRKMLGCDDDTLRNIQSLITQLNPRPGADFTQIGSDHYVQHEIIVKKTKGIWLASLNAEVMPKLRINQVYADILKRNRENSSQYLMSQMQEAKWMIKNIQQRFATILRVSQAIVDRQRNFFEHGEIAMRPLVLREIADEIGMHESTVSRVTTRKFMLTPRGVYELKYFFGSHVTTDSGGECSATAIRALIKQLVNEENSKKPLSDNQITEILGKQGIVVARRTIAKYRESLQIPPANQRKSL